MIVKFFLLGPALVEWQVPDPAQFNFMGMCKNIRADDHFLAPGIYIPHHAITAIGLDGEGVKLPTAPSVETKQ